MIRHVIAWLVVHAPPPQLKIASYSTAVNSLNLQERFFILYKNEVQSSHR